MAGDRWEGILPTGLALATLLAVALAKRKKKNLETDHFKWRLWPYFLSAPSRLFNREWPLEQHLSGRCHQVRPVGSVWLPDAESRGWSLHGTEKEEQILPERLVLTMPKSSLDSLLSGPFSKQTIPEKGQLSGPINNPMSSWA